MSYQDHLEHFFSLRAASYKLKGVDVDMNKQSFVHSYIECSFGSLPKDSTWIEKWDGEIKNAGGVGSSQSLSSNRYPTPRTVLIYFPASLNFARSR